MIEYANSEKSRLEASKSMGGEVKEVKVEEWRN